MEKASQKIGLTIYCKKELPLNIFWFTMFTVLIWYGLA